MNYRTKLLSALFILIAAGCSGKGNSPAEEETSYSCKASPEKIEVPASSTTATFSIESNTSWTVASDNSIFKVSPEKGTGKRTVTVSFTENNSQEARSATITVSSTQASYSGKVTVVQAGKEPGEDRHLIACGSSMVYIFSEQKALSDGKYNNATIWEWNAVPLAKQLGVTEARADHIDDAKPVDGGDKILITSSYSWCALVERSTKKLLFHANGVTNAHSADLLPGNRVAIACSSGDDGDCVKVFDLSKDNSLVCEVPLSSAHGVVWSEKYNKLFATGGSSLNIYTLKDWDSDEPSMDLEKSVSTSSYVKGNHDMTMMDENTLVIGGTGAATFDIPTRKMAKLAHFDPVVGVKSINVNPDTMEAYYTYASSGTSEGDYTWSSHKVRYCTDATASDGGTDSRIIEVSNINMYKVRVVSW